MNKKKNLFFDCDGTLFTWRELKEADRWMLYTEEYYVLLSAYPQMKSLVRDLKGQARLFICSVYFSENARKGKNRALDMQFGKDCFPDHQRFFVPEGESKAEYAMEKFGRALTQDDILLDDHSANLIDWEAHGGMAVKVLNGVNGQGRTWHGRRMTLDGKMDLSQMPGYRLEDREAYDSLIYHVYEQAVRDYLQLMDSRSAKAAKERSEIVQFLRDDRFCFGTGKILQRLGIA